MNSLLTSLRLNIFFWLLDILTVAATNRFFLKKLFLLHFWDLLPIVISYLTKEKYNGWLCIFLFVKLFICWWVASGKKVDIFILPWMREKQFCVAKSTAVLLVIFFLFLTPRFLFSFLKLHDCGNKLNFNPLSFFIIIYLFGSLSC